jgi:hypothetical protein
MGRAGAFLLVGLVTACSAKQDSRTAEQPKTLSAQEAAILDDSIETLVGSYEAGNVTLSEATQRLADLIEPLGGLAHQGDQSPRARELFQATGRELRRRAAKRYGIPDSLLKE